MSLLDVLPDAWRRNKTEAPPEPDPPAPKVYAGKLVIPQGYRRDRVIEWSTDDPASVERAELEFDMHRRMGYAGFASFAQTIPGVQDPRTGSTRRFEPQAEEIRMTAQFAGG